MAAKNFTMQERKNKFLKILLDCRALLCKARNDGLNQEIKNKNQFWIAASLKLLAMMAMFFSLTIFNSNVALAAKKIEEVNYFASLRAGETNVRSGPGQNYPIKFIFKLRAIPIKVISEYDNWIEIEDFQGQSGWVMQSLVSKKRNLIVQTTKEFVALRNKPSEKGRVILELENNVIGDYLKCENSWCAMKVAGKKGWIKKSEVFGD